MNKLDNRHWTIRDYSQRMTKNDWREVMLNYEDKIVFKGRVTKLVSKDIGSGIVEISKEIK